MFKGLNKTSETTSLLGDSLLKHSSNFLPTINGVEVREGIGMVCQEMTFAPLDMKSVKIGGVSMILAISTYGVLKAIIPDHKEIIYTVKRRYFSAEQTIVFNLSSYISNAKIIESNEFVYCITDNLSFVIHKDGLCRVVKDAVTPANSKIIVDAKDATIYDADDEQLTLWRTGGFCSTIPQGTLMGYRIRNEFGGRGAISQYVSVPRDDGFVAGALKGMRKDVFGVHNGKELVRDLLFYGVRSAIYEDSGDPDLTWKTSFRVILDTSYLEDRFVGMVGTSLWTNAKVTNVTFTQPATSLADAHSVVDLVLNTENIGTRMLDDVEYIPHLDVADNVYYSTTIMINPDKQAILTTHKDNVSKFTKDEYYWIPKIAIGRDSNKNFIEKKVDWAIKINSDATDLYDSVDSFYVLPFFLDSSSASEGILDMGLALYASANATYFNVEIHGIQDIDFELTGTKFTDVATGAPISTFLSWSSVLPAFAVDSSDVPCDLITFPEPFTVVPEENEASINVDVSVCAKDYNFWHDFSRATDTASVTALTIDFDIDSDGIFFYDKNYSNFEITITGIGTYDSPLLVYYNAVDADESSTARADMRFLYYYDIYRLEEDVDFWIGGSFINRRNVYKVIYANNWKETNPITHPVLLGKTHLLASASPKFNSCNMGDFNDVVFFNNMFFSCINGIIKVSNVFLECDLARTITINGNIRKLISSMIGVIVLKDNGVDIINADLTIKSFVDFPVKELISIGFQSLFLADTGEVFMSSYKRYGAENIAGQTDEYNIAIQKVSDIIIDIVENWEVYDMIYHKEKVYFSTTIGVYVFYVKDGTWWRLDYPTDSVLKFVEHEDMLYLYGGDFNNTVWASLESGGAL